MTLAEYSFMCTIKEKSLFEKLYNDNKIIMYKVAFKILKDEHLSEDAVHDAFVSCSKIIEKLSEKNYSSSHIRNYLIIAVKNAARKIYNKNKREICNNDIYDSIPNLTDVEADVENADSQERMYNLVKTLDEKYADVLILKLFYDLNNQEIADSMGIKVAAVKSRLVRAKKMLRTKLEEE